MEKTRIYYFSATGNSLYAAKELAARLPDSEVVNIAEEIRRASPVIEAEKLVLVFPSYAYGPPGMVSDFIKKAEIKAPYIAAAVTFGSHPGSTLPEIRRLLKRKGLTLDAEFRIPAVENFIPIFGPQKEDTVRRRLAGEAEALPRAAETIRAGGFVAGRPHLRLPILVSRLFIAARNLLNSFYKVSGKCNGCGICTAVCPARCISLNEKNRPVFSPGCELCQACLNWCPQRAITFGRFKEKVPRYIHTGITLPEMRLR